MTEHQVEIIVERRFDNLDARLMAGEISMEVYRKEAQAIDLWSDLHHHARFEQYLAEVG